MDNLSIWGGYADTIITNPADYDLLEVHGVRDLFKDEPGDDTCCEVDDDDPQFFSVYAHLVHGGLECIGDFQTRELADAYAQTISTAHNWPIN